MQLVVYIPKARAYYSPLGLTPRRGLAKRYAVGDDLNAVSDVMKHYNEGIIIEIHTVYG
jgi:hypothetical protein